ncbi:helix-turn-helix domain-containing protein [Aromatoleum anaerobium]|uniref:Transposase n=1 Tax=Aromatoleum anaerobium TaxID=182180 RepID=A0ABX1PTN8_9RHOO|nr:helix-turn-helix domain-containing protein [Aromatoleum anaerobium]MCK0505396.1 transposase [Aromatoleum anaerobium]MCK0507355.1 transposase [Aromatoleum anaerobium]MCK0507905.1 transposase [Aromatoleum anaerobium]
MAPYSIDLRQKVVDAYERGVGSQRQVAELFGVSISFVEKLFMRLRSTGAVAPKPHAGGKRSRLDEAARQRLAQWLHTQSDLTLNELAQRLKTELDIPIGLPRLCRVLKQMQLSRKKRRSMRRNVTPTR